MEPEERAGGLLLQPACVGTSATLGFESQQMSWSPRHLELQRALSLPGFSYYPHPGLGHSPQHCEPEGWVAVEMGALSLLYPFSR